MMIYRIDNFVESNINPITNSPYDNSWIVYIVDNGPYKMMCGSNNDCAYTLRISKTNHPNWKMYVGDFISYNEKHKRNAILVISENDLTSVQKEYTGHLQDIHTTTLS